jgi:hypothetical protein
VVDVALGSNGLVYKCEFLGLMAVAKVFKHNTTDRKVMENKTNMFSRM